MLTLVNLVKRYPAMTGLSQDRFDIAQEDAVLIMGTDDGRWINFYDVAQAALIAHRITQFGGVEGDEDDAAGTAGPVTRTDVDDVEVEYADRIWDNVPYQEADLMSTSYGQDYVRWRRMAFAGPRWA